MPTWTKVIDRGGGRALDENGVARNYGVSDIMAFGGAIYLGSARPPTASLRPKCAAARRRHVRSRRRRAAAQLRHQSECAADQSRVSAEPALRRAARGHRRRRRRQRLPADVAAWRRIRSRRQRGGRVPRRSSSYFWRLPQLRVHATTAPLGDNRLYVGTLQGRGGTVESPPGFDVVVSANGVDWSTIVDDGLGDPQLARDAHDRRRRRTVSRSAAPIRASAGTMADAPSGSESPGPDQERPVTDDRAERPTPTKAARSPCARPGFSWTGTDTPAPVAAADVRVPPRAARSRRSPRSARRRRRRTRTCRTAPTRST